MRNNTKQFIQETYENLLFRDPTAAELKKLSDILKKDKNITPEIIYYSLMSSPEYKYY